MNLTNLLPAPTLFDKIGQNSLLFSYDMIKYKVWSATKEKVLL